MGDRLAFTGALWAWNVEGGWFFVSVPAEYAAEIRDRPGPRQGFGSVRVEATVGETRWQTSIFPHTESGSYVLPMKKAVRAAECLVEGDPVDVQLELLD